MKEIFQISVPIIVAIVSSLIAYLQAVKNSKLTIKELEMKHSHELDKLTKEMEVQMKLYESQKQTDMMNSFFTGEMDVEKLAKNLDSIGKIMEQAEKIEKKLPKQFSDKR